MTLRERSWFDLGQPPQEATVNTIQAKHLGSQLFHRYTKRLRPDASTAMTPPFGEALIATQILESTQFDAQFCLPSFDSWIRQEGCKAARRHTIHDLPATQWLGTWASTPLNEA